MRCEPNFTLNEILMDVVVVETTTGLVGLLGGAEWCVYNYYSMVVRYRTQINRSLKCTHRCNTTMWYFIVPRLVCSIVTRVLQASCSQQRQLVDIAM